MSQRTRMEYLFSQLLDGELSDVEVDELARLVKENASVRELLIDHLLIDSMLTEEVGAESLTALIDLVVDEVPVINNDDFIQGTLTTNSKENGSRFWNQANTRTNKSIYSRANDLSIANETTRNRGFQASNVLSISRVRWIAAAVVMAVTAFVIGRWDNMALASPTRLVRAAQVAHQQAVERVYVVTVQDKIGNDQTDKEEMFDVRVHTQGNRFYVEMNRDDRRWVWGKNREGAFWLTLGPRRAMQIDADEVGAPLQYIGELYGLQLDSLLDSFVQYCQLTHSDESESLHVITATHWRRWQRRIQSARIEVDRETKAIRRLVLDQTLPGRGECIVTFTLVDSKIPDESKYSVNGHLEKPFTIYSRDSQPDQRRKALSSWNGTAAERWIK